MGELRQAHQVLSSLIRDLPPMDCHLAISPCLGMTVPDSTQNQIDQFVFGQIVNLFGKNRRAILHMDRSERWQPSASRPNLKRAIDAYRDHGDIRPLGQRAEAAFEQCHFAVAGSRTLGKQKHPLATFETSERFFQPAQSHSFPVDSDRIEGIRA